jgi:hypothetical protein
MTLRERLEKNIDRSSPNGCWIWTGGHHERGYGAISVNNRSRSTHRLMFDIYNGPIAEGLFVCHHCDNPSCCNPSHLFAGTHTDNMQDAVSKGRRPKGSDINTSRLSQDDVRDIIGFIAIGCNDAYIAERFEVSRMSIYCIRNGRSWQWLTGIGGQANGSN